MPLDITQRNATRNQSTADYNLSRIFIFDNRFVEGIFKNTSGATADHQGCMLVARSTAVVDGLIPVTTLNLADVIGVSAYDGTVSLANNATANINYCSKGTIDGTMLILPATVTLNTVVGNKTLRDVLESLGLHVDTSAVDNTKYDN